MDSKAGTSRGNGQSVNSEQSTFQIFGKRQPKAPIVFFIQTILIFVVVLTALVNLSINSIDESDKKLWIILLSSCVGYILPNPSIKFSSLTP